MIFLEDGTELEKVTNGFLLKSFTFLNLRAVYRFGKGLRNRVPQLFSNVLGLFQSQDHIPK